MSISVSQIQAAASQEANTLSPEQLQRVEETAKEFEALVLSQLLAPIFSSVDQSTLSGGGPQSDAFQTMLQDEYAKSIAARGGLGIADQVKASLIQLQSTQLNTSNLDPAL